MDFHHQRSQSRKQQTNNYRYISLIKEILPLLDAAEAFFLATKERAGRKPEPNKTERCALVFE
jgi:molecular chaperone GrpE (heat shock protein)